MENDHAGTLAAERLEARAQGWRRRGAAPDRGAVRRLRDRARLPSRGEGRRSGQRAEVDCARDNGAAAGEGRSVDAFYAASARGSRDVFRRQGRGPRAEPSAEKLDRNHGHWRGDGVREYLRARVVTSSHEKHRTEVRPRVWPVVAVI